MSFWSQVGGFVKSVSVAEKTVSYLKTLKDRSDEYIRGKAREEVDRKIKMVFERKDREEKAREKEESRGEESEENPWYKTAVEAGAIAAIGVGVGFAGAYGVNPTDMCANGSEGMLCSAAKVENLAMSAAVPIAGAIAIHHIKTKK